MNDLDKAHKLMGQRDHISPMTTKEEDRWIHLGLADEVPGLVAEVEQLRSKMVDMEVKLDTALQEKERWRLRAEAAERALSQAS